MKVLLCKKHGKPITLAKIRSGHKNSGCNECVKECGARYRSPEKRNKRSKKWDNTFIACLHCPGKRCQKSPYKKDGLKYCRTCMNRNRTTGKIYECVYRGQKKQQESGYHANCLRSWRRRRKLMGGY